MRAIDGDRLKRKAQKVATEAWKMKTKATVEVILNQFIDWINDAPTIEPEKRTEEHTETHACDYINRKDAIDAHYEYCNKHPDAGFPVWSLKILKDLPSAQPEPKWIPCSERLPDKPNVYTVTDHNGRVVRYVYNDNESSREYWKRCAKAWMPLPEPYAERKTDDGE